MEEYKTIAQALFIPFAEVPVIVTLPADVAAMLAPIVKTPSAYCWVPHEVPLTVSEPELVVTVAALIKVPTAQSDAPLPLTPVIVKDPDPPACTLDEANDTPAAPVFNAPRPSIAILPAAVFTFTEEPLMLTPSKEPV